MNLAIVAIVLKDFCAPFIVELNECYHTTNDRFEAVYNAASDAGNTEVLELLDWIAAKELKATYFPA